MKQLITLLILTASVQLSFAAVQMKSYYFKKNSKELTSNSEKELLEFKATLNWLDVQFIEFNSFVDGVRSNSSDELSNDRIEYLINYFELTNEPVAINSWGSKHIQVNFAPLNWDRVDVYYNVEQFSTASTINKGAKEDGLWTKSVSITQVPADLTTSTQIENQPTPEVVFSQPLILNILFEGGTSVILKETYSELHELYDTLCENPMLTAHIRGHVCCDNNLRISKKRAKAVHDFLTYKGISEERLSFKGYSNKIPLVFPERGPKDRKLNRRVDVIFSMEVAENELPQ